MKAIVLGATGATGRELVDLLLRDERFEKIIVLTRREYFEPHERLQEVIIDFDKMEDYAPYMQGDIAFSCLGTTRKIAGSKDAQWKVDHDYQLLFAKLCYANHVERFVLLSAVGVQEKSVFFYNKMKGTLESNIKKIDFPYLTIVQPSVIRRPESERFLELMMEQTLLLFNKFGVLKGYRPITTRDLASSMIFFGLTATEHLNIVTVKMIVDRFE
ncbi:NAD(P)H-binding protein [Sphingobacterium sp. UT-1RO-CII-1]|uniref:NAD(P)H-binding protein n=1 Tax=Sphingobacterium sp. UT-1RO-CII-1 TaxID=2995225 RepID=UPI00227CD9A6|nr:NAD(P)H-binding protein [Sphingobacterium sp. UT-1RO-CII-1]MCY4779039.1 NAD(P)H-binding protein [Sphingobacterium sp. UT-1RO-CII-1]